MKEQHRQLPKTLLLLGCVLPWLVFGLLAIKIETSGHFVGDRRALTFLNQHATAGLDQLAIGLAHVGDTGPMLGVGLLVVLGLLRRRQCREALVFAVAVGGSMLLTQVLKPLLARPRPDLWVSITPAFTYSFPSGHAMDTAAVATALGLLLGPSRARRPAWVLGALFVLGVGWSRMYLGVHFPSDVLAGWASAGGWVVAVHLLFGPASRPAGPLRSP